jgi:hypothetical protein
LSGGVAPQDEESEDLGGEGALQGEQRCWRDEDAPGMAQLLAVVALILIGKVPSQPVV